LDKVANKHFSSPSSKIPAFTSREETIYTKDEKEIEQNVGTTVSIA
jgi:hypothetical protein